MTRYGSNMVTSRRIFGDLPLATLLVLFSFRSSMCQAEDHSTIAEQRLTPESAATAPPEALPSESSSLSSPARVERQRIVSDLDRKAAAAKRDYGVEVRLFSALQTCAPLDATVTECQHAADKVSVEIDRQVDLAIRRAEVKKSPSPEPAYNVTVIEQHDTVVIPHPIRPRPITRPGVPSKSPGDEHSERTTPNWSEKKWLNMNETGAEQSNKNSGNRDTTSDLRERSNSAPSRQPDVR